MILNKEIEIILGYKLDHYAALGYKNVKSGNKLIVKVEDLPLKCKYIIHVKCDICEKEKNIEYFSYIRNIKKYNFYTCIKCAPAKIKQTNLKKYGVENIFQCKEIKDKITQSNLIKHGVEYTSQIKISRDNFKLTNIFKYGVDNPMQNSDFFEKQQKNCFLLKKHDKINLNYRGTYEKDFLDFCNDTNIKIQKGKRFEYFIDDKKHYYFSDFYHEKFNLIIEIKSGWTYNNNLEINLIKEKAAINNGYNYLFIIDKDYSEFMNIIKNN